MIKYDNSQSVQASAQHSLASHFGVSIPLVHCLFALMVRSFAALGLIRKVSAIIVLLCCLWFLNSADSTTPIFYKQISSMFLSFGISGVFLFAALIALRDNGSLVHEQVMNSASSPEGTNHQ
jgi:hypothetical protein